ncbi:pheophorbide a oxygenase [Haematococcus lacustris]
MLRAYAPLSTQRPSSPVLRSLRTSPPGRCGGVYVRAFKPSAPPPPTLPAVPAPSAPLNAKGHQAPLTSPASAPDSSSQVEGGEKMDWFAAWWPVVPVDQVDSKVPQAVDLLGLKLVVWADSQGCWHTLQDRCPHRLAPLSEGRVEGGNLMCSYHGWQFSPEGRCAAIPQLEDPKALATACASPRNCVQAYPTKVVHGLLWVWPQAGAAGAAAAAAQPLPRTALTSLLEAEADPEGSVFYQSTAWFMRDMPIRFDTLVENVVDPSHVYFAHHGVPGVSRSGLINPKMTVQAGGAITAQGGYMVTREAVEHPPTPASEYGLLPPNLMTYRYPYSESHFYCIPTKPGWSRIITCIVGRKDAQVPAPIALMSKLVARWPVLEHVAIRHPVLDGDLYMLHAGERALIREGNDGSRAYYMPANADSAVVAWRKWLSKFGGEVPTCTAADAALMPPLMPKEQVLDRYQQHTAQCRTCQSALRRLDTARWLLGLIAPGLAIVLLARLAAGLTSLTQPAFLVGAVVAGLAAALKVGLERVREQFYYQPYVHALRD